MSNNDMHDKCDLTSQELLLRNQINIIIPYHLSTVGTPAVQATSRPLLLLYYSYYDSPKHVPGTKIAHELPLKYLGTMS